MKYKLTIKQTETKQYMNERETVNYESNDEVSFIFNNVQQATHLVERLLASETANVSFKIEKVV